MAKRSNAEPTMRDYMHQLDVEDQAIICNLVRADGDERYSHIHRGLLPFMPLRAVVETLDRFAGTHPTRLVKVLRDKLKVGLWVKSDITIWDLYLDDAKVSKRFGMALSKGIGVPVPQLSSKKKVTAGLKWSLPARDYVPDDDVLVTPMMTLYRVSKGYWRVSGPTRYQQHITQWLVDYCGRTDAPRKGSRGRR